MLDPHREAKQSVMYQTLGVHEDPFAEDALTIYSTIHRSETLNCPGSSTEIRRIAGLKHRFKEGEQAGVNTRTVTSRNQRDSSNRYELYTAQVETDEGLKLVNVSDHVLYIASVQEVTETTEEVLEFRCGCPPVAWW